MLVQKKDSWKLKIDKVNKAIQVSLPDNWNWCSILLTHLLCFRSKAFCAFQCSNSVYFPLTYPLAKYSWYFLLINVNFMLHFSLQSITSRVIEQRLKFSSIGKSSQHKINQNCFHFSPYCFCCYSQSKSFATSSRRRFFHTSTFNDLKPFWALLLQWWIWMSFDLMMRNKHIELNRIYFFLESRWQVGWAFS